LLFFPAGQVLADSLDINLNNDSGRITYEFAVGDAGIPISGLYGNDSKNGRYWAVSGGLQVSGDNFLGDTLMAGSLGVNAYTIDTEDFEILALGLGGMIGFYPNNGLFGFHVGGYYSPAIVTGLDGQNFWEARARADFRFFDQASAYIGYRVLQADLKDGTKDVTIDDGFVGGINIRF
jgi:YfaZ precursor